MTKKSAPDRTDEFRSDRGFDQTNGVLGEDPSPGQRKGASRSGDVPTATNMLLGGN